MLNKFISIPPNGRTAKAPLNPSKANGVVAQAVQPVPKAAIEAPPTVEKSFESFAVVSLYLKTIIVMSIAVKTDPKIIKNIGKSPEERTIVWYTE